MTSVHRSRAARRRGDGPLRVYRLGAEPGDDLSATTTAEQRLDMMWPLALDAWEVGRRELPDYSRAQTPVSLRPARAGGAATPTG